MKKSIFSILGILAFYTTSFAQHNAGNNGKILMLVSNPSLSKQTVKRLALNIGFINCFDFGGDDKVQLLEQFALSWINLTIMQGHGRNLAFKLIRR